MLISEEIAERLMPKFSRKAEERQQHIKSIANGTVEQLQELVKLVSTNEVSQFNQLPSALLQLFAIFKLKFYK